MTPHEPAFTRSDEARLEPVVLRKVALRLLPYLCLLYLINILDRNNVSFAQLRMLDDLQMSEEAYGFGAGIFYIGYFAFEVPSNLILNRIGARRWIARILLSWGLISSCMMFVTGPVSFTLLRLLLGFAEAGFFPGILLYLTYWFPVGYRARVVSMFMAASPLVLIIGGPLSGALMQYTAGRAGLTGWQWLFLLEGVPAVLLGVVTYFYLTDRPKDAHWLTPPERTWLSEKIAGEEALRERRHGLSLSQALTDRRVWHLILLFSTIGAGISALGANLPQFIGDRFPHLKELDIGWLVAIPGIGSIICMTIVGIHSDRTGERRWHIAGPALLAALGWSMYAAVESPLLSLLALTLTHIGMTTAMAIFWSLPSTFLHGRAAAGGIAMINAFGNLGGFAGPNIIGQLYQPATRDFTWGILAMALLLVSSAILVLSFRYERAGRRPEPTE